MNSPAKEVIMLVDSVFKLLLNHRINIKYLHTIIRNIEIKYLQKT